MLHWRVVLGGTLAIVAAPLRTAGQAGPITVVRAGRTVIELKARMVSRIEMVDPPDK